MVLSNDEIRDVVINYLDDEIKEIRYGASIDFVRGEIEAVTYMLEMFNLPKLADIVQRHFSSKLYDFIRQEMKLDEYEET